MIKFLPNRLLIILLAGLPLVGISQSSFTTGLSTADEYSSALCVDQNDNVYIGAILDNHSWLYKKNNQGTILWSKQITFSNDASSISTVKIIGDTLFGCGWISNGSQIQGGIYFKLNATDGTQYWIKGEATSKNYFSGISYANGQYFLTGAETNGINDYNGKVWSVSSTTGDVNWQTPAFGLKFPSFNNDYIDDILGASEMVNGKMFLTGRSYVNGAAGGINMRTLLIGIDETGSIFLNKYLLFNTSLSGTHRFYGTKVAYDGADSLIIMFFGDDYAFSSSTDYKIGLIKTDLNGIVSWAKSYDIDGVSIEVAKEINSTNDAYVLFGSVNHSSTNPKLGVIKTDKSGNFINAKVISSPTGFLSCHTASIYAGGSSRFMNGKHYFPAAYYTDDINNRDILQLVLDENLNDSLSCLTIIPALVSTTDIAPFSADLIRVDFPDSYVTQTINAISNYTFSNPCSAAALTFNQVTSCLETTITANVNGLQNPQITWSDGTVGQTLITTEIDTFIVTVTSSLNCCFIQDTVVGVQGVSPLHVLLLSDTLICTEDLSDFILHPVVQNQNGTLNYLWSTGESEDSILVNTSGQYWIQATDTCSSASDTIFIQFDTKPEVQELTIQSATCNEFGALEINTIYGGTAPYSYQINGGVSTSENVYENLSSGNYLLTVTDYLGCTFDSIVTVPPGNSTDNIHIPNCFTPNKADTINSTWFVSASCCEVFSCTVFNRWGNPVKVFKDINDGWDGLSNGSEATEGVYYYLIDLKYYNGTTKQYSGPVTLIR